MSAIAGTNLASGNVVLAIDMFNTDKSWKGAPANNLVSNPIPISTTNFVASGGANSTVTFNADDNSISWYHPEYSV